MNIIELYQLTLKIMDLDINEVKQLLNIERQDYDHKNGQSQLKFNVLMTLLETERDMHPDQMIKLIIDIAEFVC